MDIYKQSVTVGNSLDLKIDPACGTSEIRADITITQYTGIRIWGQILDQSKCPVPNAQVKLVKIINSSCHDKFQGIAHTTTDTEGFYQFEIYCNEAAWYKILVGKASTGKEIIIDSQYPVTDSSESC